MHGKLASGLEKVEFLNNLSFVFDASKGLSKTCQSIDSPLTQQSKVVFRM